MSLREIRDEAFKVRPDCLQRNVDLKGRATAICSSKHGFIYGVGMQTGAVFACDSRSFNNRYEFNNCHSSEVTAMAFSRDTRLCASGDDTGLFRVHKVIECEMVFEHQFEGGIHSIEGHPKDVNVFIVLLKSGDLFAISSGNVIQCPGSFASVSWSHKQNGLFAATGKTIVQISFPDFTETHQWSFEKEKMREIVSLWVSNNEHFFMFMDKTNEVRLFSVDTQIICAKFIEKIDRKKKLQWAAFDRFDENLILSPKSMNDFAFSIFNIDRNTRMGDQVRGPAFDNTGLIIDPLNPIVTVRHKTGVLRYAADLETTMQSQAPFDSESETDKELTPADFYGTESGYFDDDKDFPEQLIKLPLHFIAANAPA